MVFKRVVLLVETHVNILFLKNFRATKKNRLLLKSCQYAACLTQGTFFIFSPEYNCETKKMFVLLYHQNPPSLSTMLKCAGRFFIIASVFCAGKMKQSPLSSTYLCQPTHISHDKQQRKHPYSPLP